MLELRSLQQWLQTSILGGQTANASVHVLGDEHLPADARLDIYVRAFRQRLIECLRNEYPVLAALAGPTAFELFAHGYIATQPPRSYTLYDFGAGFADYLEAARPTGDGTPQTLEAIPAALARLERAKAEVLRARGVERDAPALAESGRDLQLHASRAYRRPDSVRLLALPFDFTVTLRSANAPPPLPVPQPWFAAIARLNYRVACHGIEDWQHAWLSSIPDVHNPPPPQQPPLTPRLTDWLRTAVSRGLVVSVG